MITKVQGVEFASRQVQISATLGFTCNK